MPRENCIPWRNRGIRSHLHHRDFASELAEETAKYRDLPLPAIVSIPGGEGSTGFGMNNLRRAVERAVGADILFKDNSN